jgi:hypothetical protein
MQGNLILAVRKNSTKRDRGYAPICCKKRTKQNGWVFGLSYEIKGNV